MATYLLSDSHFLHPLVASIRGFNTVAEHDWTVQNNIRRAIKGDTNPELIVVGDVSMGNWREGIRFFATLPAKVILVLGNHDRAYPGRSRAFDYQREFLTAFHAVVQSARLQHEGQEFLVSHYPYSGDDRNAHRNHQWRLRDLGVPLLHGDTHSSEQFSLSDDGTPQIHIGLDAWGLKPVRLDEAAELLTTKGQPND